MTALSGGIDSVVLLDILARLAPSMGFELSALHVHHGLSPHAHAWARFCRSLCRDRGIACRVVRVDVARGNSVERSARELRYAAFRRSGADHVALAHNQDDQAETLLLQLLRGAGVKGLAAMPAVRALDLVDASGPRLLRPLIAVPRSRIEDYARRRRLQWIEDESNLDPAYTRNWLRHEIMPRFAGRLPGYRGILSRAAAHFAEASLLLDDLARLDAAAALEGNTLSARALRELPLHRAKNLLRFVIAARGFRTPDAATMGEALKQVLSARRDRNPRIDLGECELRRHADAIHLLPTTASARHDDEVVWGGERRIALPQGGVLEMVPRRGSGLSAARLAGAPVTFRPRVGGERLQPDPARPRRTVKNLLQEARMAPWLRRCVPFIFCGDDLVCVPGIGIDCHYQAQRGEPSFVPGWHPPS